MENAPLLGSVISLGTVQEIISGHFISLSPCALGFPVGRLQIVVIVDGINGIGMAPGSIVGTLRKVSVPVTKECSQSCVQESSFISFLRN
jgi:hypothetical protein